MHRCPRGHCWNRGNGQLQRILTRQGGKAGGAGNLDAVVSKEYEARTEQLFDTNPVWSDPLWQILWQSESHNTALKTDDEFSIALDCPGRYLVVLYRNGK
jgi:hypothetical protein